MIFSGAADPDGNTIEGALRNAITGFTLVLLDVTTPENVRYEILQDYVPGSLEIDVEFVNSQFLDNGSRSI